MPRVALGFWCKRVKTACLLKQKYPESTTQSGEGGVRGSVCLRNISDHPLGLPVATIRSKVAEMNHREKSELEM